MEKEVQVILTVQLLWIAYSISAAYIEAFFYHYRDHDKHHGFNEHILYNIQRAIVAVCLFGTSPKFLACAALMFPLIHDGIYYVCRNSYNPDIYKRGFFDDPSQSSSASFEFGFWVRLIMFLAGSLACYM